MFCLSGVWICTAQRFNSESQDQNENASRGEGVWVLPFPGTWLRTRWWRSWIQRMLLHSGLKGRLRQDSSRVDFRHCKQRVPRNCFTFQRARPWAMYTCTLRRQCTQTHTHTCIDTVYTNSYVAMTTLDQAAFALPPKDGPVLVSKAVRSLVDCFRTVSEQSQNWKAPGQDGQSFELRAEQRWRRSSRRPPSVVPRWAKTQKRLWARWLCWLVLTNEQN